jgi:hypothetical protein
VAIATSALIERRRELQPPGEKRNRKQVKGIYPEEALMATVHTPELELIEHSHSKKTATLMVTYVLHQSAVERNMTGLRYKETIQLWGADSPDSDDFLYAFPTTTYSNSPSVHIERSRTVTLGDDILDEDGFFRPTDEVYAKVCVTPQLPSGHCKNSNEIHHRF